ncbi:uncharacterized protein LOC129536153 [Moschus berezovskii]|uniref:uncharacterized protein LOC129536153 n=1 Tax=Moschus berezovskii TaxID=68408 RepID=UPI00244478B4|nr:uncharacterized protein LOC129536153 [Moschus berezovskii]
MAQVVQTLTHMEGQGGPQTHTDLEDWAGLSGRPHSHCLSAPPPPRLRPPPTSSPPLRQFQTFLDNEVIAPLPIGCAGPSVTGSPAAALASLSAVPGHHEGSDWSALLSLLQRAWRGGGGREAGVVGGPAASVPERSRPRPCLWYPRGGSGERDRPILPTRSAPLAARPPLTPTSPQLRASRLDAEPREETRAVESRSGDRRGARAGRRAGRRGDSTIVYFCQNSLNFLERSTSNVCILFDRRGVIGMELNFICLWEL